MSSFGICTDMSTRRRWRVPSSWYWGMMSILLLSYDNKSSNGSTALVGVTFAGAFVSPSLPQAFRDQQYGDSSMSRRQESPPFVLNQQVVSELLSTEMNDSEEQNGNNKNGKKKPSRSERKALERAKKAQTSNNRRSNQGRRKHNFSERASATDVKGDIKNGRYDLHSTNVAKLNANSTADDVLKAIKRAQNYHDVHDIAVIENFLLKETDRTFAYGYRGSLLSRLAVAALHMDNHPLARKAIKVRREEHFKSILPMESAAIIRGLLRVHNVSDAWNMLYDEIPIPDDISTILSFEEKNNADGSNNSEDEHSTTIAMLKERVKHHALSLASIVSRHFFEGEPIMAVYACEKLVELGPIVRQLNLNSEELTMPWSRIIRGASQCESQRRDGSLKNKNNMEQSNEDNNDSIIDVSHVKLPCNLVYAVLNAMTTFPSDNNDRVYEALSNALVRRVNFVTGAISMDKCPQSDGRGEAAFIGRSNVGKSSLVNMILNRKSLAYTSKRPGKTQQFNYFTVNDKVGIEKELKYGDDVPGRKDMDSFYIVDVPGFGYAKVPEKQKQEWLQFMKEYISSRNTLRVLFHLIDSRHGPTGEDQNIMNFVGEYLPSSATYVVVLTKADKNIKNNNANTIVTTSNINNERVRGKVSKNVMHSVREAMKQSNVGKYPVIMSSAETKLGRDDLWRFLRLAAEGQRDKR